MTKFEQWYIGTLNRILTQGVRRKDRTGTGTISIFEASYKIDLREEQPLLLHRKLDWKKPINEMHGFLNGFSTEKQFQDVDVPFWNGYGLKEPLMLKSLRSDSQLASLYINKMLEEGKFKTYDEGMKHLNSLGYDAGLRTILDAGIHRYQYKEQYPKGYLGPIYGVIWRGMAGGSDVDQIEMVIDKLLNNPNDRRIVVDGYDPSVLPDSSIPPYENPITNKQTLPPCHMFHQYYTEEIDFNERVEMFFNKYPERKWEGLHRDELDKDGIPKYYLDLTWHQRSWDFVLGAPANWMGYTALLMMMAKHVNMVPRYLKADGYNVHIYNDHIPGVKTIIDRHVDLLIRDDVNPKLILNSKAKTIYDYTSNNFIVIDYNPMDSIKFKISI